MGLELAEQFEENEQYDRAYEEYKKILTQRPKSIETLERLGHVAVILDKKEEATQYYNKILELDATSILAYEQLMDIYVHTNRYMYYISRGNLHVVQHELSHAINDFRKALDKAQSPEEINSTRFVLANLYEQSGKNHQAIDEYLRIIDTLKIDDEISQSTGAEAVYLKLCGIYVKEDALVSAIETLERAISEGIDTEKIQETLAQLYLKNNQPQEARKYTKDDLTKIKSLLDEEKNAEAFELLEKSKNNYKNNAQYYSLLAQYYFNKQDWDEALNSVNEFSKREKNSPLEFQMKALIYEEKGQEYDAHLNWAKYNLSRKDKDVALNEYLLAYQIKDEDADLVQSIAELLEQSGDKVHAGEFWEKLAAIDLKNKKAFEKIAEFKESIGDYKAETQALETLYSLDMKNSLVVKKLAIAYEKIRNKEKALEYYKKFIAISPVNDEYEKIQSKIAKLESTDFEEDEGILGKFIGLFVKNK